MNRKHATTFSRSATVLLYPAALLFVMAWTGCAGDAPTTSIEPAEPAEVKPLPGPEPRVETLPKIEAAPERVVLEPEPPATVASLIPATPPAKRSLPLPKPLATKPWHPEVVLSQGHTDTCLVQVGDVLPELTLQSLGGEATTLSKLYGERFTVLVFWTKDHPYAAEQFARLRAETDEPFSKFGVNVVAVNVGDSQQAVDELNTKHKNNFSCLRDPEGKALAQLAREKLPRTYLLDSEGNVLWFDIEYSLRSTQELKNALYFHLLRQL